jgi:putative acetyltransferase
LAEPEPGLVCLVACAGAAKAGELVGILGVHTHPNQPRRKHAGELGMAVRDDWQGRGVGTALLQAALELADGWLNLSRLELVVWCDNEPALRLYRRHGFEVEGTLRRYGWRDGREVDALILGRLRPETKGAAA